MMYILFDYFCPSNSFKNDLTNTDPFILFVFSREGVKLLINQYNFVLMLGINSKERGRSYKRSVIKI